MRKIDTKPARSRGANIEKSLRALWLGANREGWKGATGIKIPLSGVLSTAPIDYAISRRFLDGGYVEVVTLRSRAILIVDEEGLLKDLPLNNIASLAAARPIFGNAIYVPKEDAKKAMQ